MPIPANWLEELVIEWLDLDGFLISTSVFVPAKGGGRIAPDVVGARRDENGKLSVRHCEAAMFLIDAPENVARRYAEKFSQKVQEEVRQCFDGVFHVRGPDHVEYEKWVITFQASKNVQEALRNAVPGVKIYLLKNFIRDEVLRTIRAWKQRPTHRQTTTMPKDKWIFDLIDRFEHFGLLAKDVTE